MKKFRKSFTKKELERGFPITFTEYIDYITSFSVSDVIARIDYFEARFDHFKAMAAYLQAMVAYIKVLDSELGIVFDLELGPLSNNLLI